MTYPKQDEIYILGINNIRNVILVLSIPFLKIKKISENFAEIVNFEINI